MALVFQDIQIHGAHKEADFALGWMCPIYKKKDRTEVCNYRLVMLMNTDYKILTKVMALQLLENLYWMVYNDQTGFVLKHSIFNNIRLARAIIDHVEATEKDGTIVALDQEKAYDKIKHDYLWKTLEEFGVPQPFIKTAKELYKYAFTNVVVNGCISKTFRVTRGVQQGDPLSCALFNLAIEPLACHIREDADLRGLEILAIEKKLIINLYADNTCLSLSKNNNMDHMQEILDKWCGASGVKSNTEKTKIIPIGTREYRARMVETRRVNQ